MPVNKMWLRCLPAALMCIALLLTAVPGPAMAQKTKSKPSLSGYDAAYKLFVEGKFGEAAVAATKLAREIDSSRGRSDPASREAHLLLGTIYLKEGKFQDAMVELDGLLQNFEQPLDLTNRDVYATINNIAALQVQTGRAEEALQLYDALLTVDPHRDPVLYANALSDKAAALVELGRADQAEEPAQKAVDILASLAQTNLDLADDRARALRRLSDVFDAQGELNKAGYALYGMWNLYRDLGDTEPENIARAQVDLAGIWNRAGMSTEALKLANGVIEAKEALLPQHPDMVVEALNQRAQALIQLNRAAEAEPDLIEAIEIAQNRNVPERFLGTSYNNLGFLYDEIETSLRAKSPQFAGWSLETPVSVAEVQKTLLKEDEALVLLFHTEALGGMPAELYSWVVTKTNVRWVRSDLGTAALAREVQALRCGLDKAAWKGEGLQKCAGLLKLSADEAPKDGDILPFDLERAHAL